MTYTSGPLRTCIIGNIRVGVSELDYNKINCQVLSPGGRRETAFHAEMKKAMHLTYLLNASGFLLMLVLSLKLFIELTPPRVPFNPDTVMLILKIQSYYCFVLLQAV